MKKLLYITLSALMLTACANGNNAPEVTSAVPTETTVPETALTLTESFTAENFSEPENNTFKLAVFNPFENTVKINDEAHRELSEAVEKISDAWAFWVANPNCFHQDSEYINNYADTENVFEINPETGHGYAPLNTEIAETETELTEYFHSVFSENFLGSNFKETIGERIFNPGNPYYKTIDGKLCIKTGPYHDTKKIITDRFIITEYDGNTARILADAECGSGEKFLCSMRLSKSDKYGWQLDSRSMTVYDETVIDCVYTLLLKTDKINRILSGETLDANSPVIIDETEYYPSSLDMSIEEMRGFFREIFSEKSLASADDLKDGKYGDKLCENYIKKYIDDVYTEHNGILHRKADAPVWYIPELGVIPDSSITRSADRAGFSAFTANVAIDGDYQPLTIKYTKTLDAVTSVQFASGLPVRERTAHE